jgi:hypothetical protein
MSHYDCHPTYFEKACFKHRLFLTIDSSIPFSCFGEVESFCKGADLNDLNSSRGLAGHLATAWLDDRKRAEGLGQGSKRKYPSRLTPTDLFHALKAKVDDCPPQNFSSLSYLYQLFNLPGRPDVDRRLV